MTTKNIKVKSKEIGLHKAIYTPEWGGKTVITDDCFAYVELYIDRYKKELGLNKRDREYALSCWKQARKFYDGINCLPVLAKPLLAYYSILNASKTLLICKHHLPQNEQHGLSGMYEGGAYLSNEIIKVKNTGILPSMSKYFKENETRNEFNIKDLLYNLPYVQRAYNLSYRSSTELFIPIEKSFYVHKKDRYGDEGWLDIILNKKYDNKTFLKKIPDTFEKNSIAMDERKLVLRTKQRIRFHSQEDIAKQCQRISAKHRRYRESLFYIAGSQRLWYLKRNVEADKIINMYSPTITFAIMHRLSELARYSPDRLQHILDSQMGWVVSEFIKLAPYQFIDEISSEITGKEIMPPMIRS